MIFFSLKVEKCSKVVSHFFGFLVLLHLREKLSYNRELDFFSRKQLSLQILLLFYLLFH